MKTFQRGLLIGTITLSIACLLASLSPWRLRREVATLAGATIPASLGNMEYAKWKDAQFPGFFEIHLRFVADSDAFDELRRVWSLDTASIPEVWQATMRNGPVWWPPGREAPPGSTAMKGLSRGGLIVARREPGFIYIFLKHVPEPSTGPF